MKYKPFYPEKYIEYQSTYHFPLLVCKTIEYMKLENDTIKNLNRMIFHDYDLFEDGQEVYERIVEAMENEEKICIYGDYDMDGILATTILMKTFNTLNYKNVGYHIPNRFEDGYGLNVERVKQIASKGYSLIITVDNGISAFDAVEEAMEEGVDVIITDHHAISDDVPLAYGILHTKLSPRYPFKEICGGMVAYKLATKLLGRHDMYLFTLAACTTISDMMPLLDENRAVVKKGLQLMNSNRYPAITKLMSNPAKEITVTTIGFEIAPKINAVGRLPDLMNPNLCVKYFLNGDRDNPLLDQFVAKFNELNSKRQSMTTSSYNLLNKNLNQELPYIFLYEEPVHEGILGLLAGKFSKEYHKVSFIMNYDEKNNIYKGSARSIPGFSIHQFLMSASEDLEAFGGHAMAGGFSVKYNRMNEFESKVAKAIDETEFGDETEDFVVIDENDLNIQSIDGLKRLEPFGQDFEKPLYGIEHVTIENQVLLKNAHLKAMVKAGNTTFNALWFNHREMFEKGQYTLIGELSINEFRNMRTVQLLIKDAIKE